MRLYRQKGSKMWWADHSAKGRRFRESMKTTDEREARRRAKEWSRQLDEKYAEDRQRVMLSAAIESYMDDCHTHDLAKTTIRGYRETLARFLGHVGDEDVSLWSEDDAVEVVSDYLRVRNADLACMSGDRVPIGTFFNYLRQRRWYRGGNPADAKLHRLRRPRRKGVKASRRTKPEEDLILRREGHKSPLWPVLLLTRWAGMRRGEACTVRWSEVNLDAGYADVVGHEGGRKHPRRVWMAGWVVMQLRAMKPAWLPNDGEYPIWPHHQDTASDILTELCDEHLSRRLSFNDLRASFATDCYERGLTPSQESRIVGHGVAVAEKHYLDYEAKEARGKLPPDPLDGTDENIAEPAARIA